MNTINDGGPALLKCARCEMLAARYQGHQWLCAMHYRFGQMRAKAKQAGKSVPSHEELHTLASEICSDCGVQMKWLAKGNQTTVATLQHYRDGSTGLSAGLATRGIFERQRAQRPDESEELVQAMFQRISNPLAKE